MFFIVVHGVFRFCVFKLAIGSCMHGLGYSIRIWIFKCFSCFDAFRGMHVCVYMIAAVPAAPAVSAIAEEPLINPSRS